MSYAEQDAIVEQIQRIILMLVKTLLNVSDMTWDDVEAVYASGQFPKVNNLINYILGI